MARPPKGPKQITTLNHEADARRNIPTAEMADLAAMQEEIAPVGPVAFPRARPLAQGEVRERDEDLDPQIVWNGARIRLTKDQVAQLAETGEIEIGDAQLVWRGKDRQDWSDLIVTAPPLYIQEKVHPKAIIDDLMRQSKVAREEASDAPDLFADFNGLADPMARTEFYQHDQHWSNRMILGDSLQVMASLAERGIAACIPSKSNRKIAIPHDPVLYHQRHKIENMFGRLKDWQRIHTRYDRCAHTSFSAICIAATVIFWLSQ